MKPPLSSCTHPVHKEARQSLLQLQQEAEAEAAGVASAAPAEEVPEAEEEAPAATPSQPRLKKKKSLRKRKRAYVCKVGGGEEDDALEEAPPEKPAPPELQDVQRVEVPAPKEARPEQRLQTQCLLALPAPPCLPSHSYDAEREDAQDPWQFDKYPEVSPAPNNDGCASPPPQENLLGRFCEVAKETSPYRSNGVLRPLEDDEMTPTKLGHALTLYMSPEVPKLPASRSAAPGTTSHIASETWCAM